MSKKKYAVVVQAWEDIELGFDPTPSGHSFHLTEADRDAYVKAHWSEMPKHPPASKYAQPSGKPYQERVSSKIFAQLKESESKRGIYRPGPPSALI